MVDAHAVVPQAGGADPELLRFFRDNWKPGAIGMIGTCDPIGMVIRRLQAPLVEGGQPSWWDHCFIMGELRLDKRGQYATVTRSPYILESAYGVDLPGRGIRSGVQENWVGRWCGKDTEHAGMIDFDLPDTERDCVLATGLQLASERVRYPVKELLGTWLAIVRRNVALINPMMKVHALYCSAFVRYCYRRAGRDFVTRDVSMKNTTPEHLAAAAQKEGKLRILR